MRRRTAILPAFAAAVLWAVPGHADEVEIVDATARQAGNGWAISVTLRHADSGWEHYADLWQVYSPEGELLGERVLLHPHVDEQPFTRSQSGIRIPEGTAEVVIRARDTVHGMSSQEYRLRLAP